MKVFIKRDAGPVVCRRSCQNLQIRCIAHRDFAHMHGVPTALPKQLCRPERKSLIQKNLFHAA